MELDGQPRGAGVHELGAQGIVTLQVTVERTGVVQSVRCYILDSSKPIWQGELKDCGIVIGTRTRVQCVDCKGNILTSTKASKGTSAEQGKVSDSADVATPGSKETPNLTDSVTSEPEKAPEPANVAVPAMPNSVDIVSLRWNRASDRCTSPRPTSGILADKSSKGSKPGYNNRSNHF